MELNSTQMDLVAQICEISTRMNVPASAGDFANEKDVPEGAILRMHTFMHTAFITKDQLAAAKRILRIIYNANRDFFEPERRLGEFTDRGEDLPDESISESFTADDIIDAINLGVYAVETHIEIHVYRESFKNDHGYIQIKPVDARSYENIPFRCLGLMSRILGIVCAENKHFKQQQD